MSIRLLAAAAAAAIGAVPMAVNGTPTPPPTPTSPQEPTWKRSCETNAALGSRLRSIRDCRPRSEREEMRQEARRAIERIQSTHQ